MLNAQHNLSKALTQDGCGVFSWYGTPLGQGVEAEEVLRNVLYRYWYATGGPVPIDRSQLGATQCDLALISRLRERYGSEWTTIRTPMVRQDLVLFPYDATVKPGPFLAGPGATSLHRVQPFMLPGAVTFVARHDDLTEDSARIYFSRAGGDDAELAARVIDFFRDHLPVWLAKVMVADGGPARADGILGCVRSADLSAALLHALEVATRKFRGKSSPLFTFKYAEGMSLARSPQGGESFGLRVTGPLAQAIAHGEDWDDITSLARRAWRPLTIDVNAPHGMVQLGLDASITASTTPPPRPERPDVDRQAVRELAWEFLRSLATRGLSHDGCRTWVGWDPYRGMHVLTGEIYSGTAGLALAFAAANGHRQDETLRISAIEASHHALHSTRHRRSRGAGLLVGNPGTLAAVTYVARALNDTNLANSARGRLVAGNVVRRSAKRLTHDLVCGDAGTLFALSVIAGLDAKSISANDAHRLAAALVSEAQPRKVGQRQWGLAHGNAGLALALTSYRERFSGTPGYVDSADGIRQVSGRGKRQETSTWCRGSLGVTIAAPSFVTGGGPPPAQDMGLCHGLAAHLVVDRQNAIPASVLVTLQQAISALDEGRSLEIALMTSATGLAWALLADDASARLVLGVSGNARSRSAPI